MYIVHLYTNYLFIYERGSIAVFVNFGLLTVFGACFHLFLQLAGLKGIAVLDNKLL